MSASTLTSSTIPDAGVAAEFSHGEQALSTGSTAVGTYHLCLPLDLEGGIYTLKIHSTVYGSTWIGDDGLSLRRFAVITAGQTLEADVYVRQSRARLDVVLFNQTAGSFWTTLSLWKGGIPVYVSTSANWRWGSSRVADSDMPDIGDYRLSLPVWTVSPNWAAGVTERLAWKTEIIQDEKNLEQRRSKLRHPFRSWDAQFLRSELNRMRLDNFSIGAGASRFLAPFWPEQLRSPYSIASGSQQIIFAQGTLVNREFVEGSLVLISTDPESYEVVKVDSVSTAGVQDILNLTAATTRAWGAGTRLTPLYECTLTDTPQMTLHTDRTASFALRFAGVTTHKLITPDWGYCAPLWRYSIDRSQGFSTTFERNVFMLDVGTGTPDIVDTAEESRVSVQANAVLFGRENVVAYRSFLAEARGQSQRFWWPSGTHDLEPLGDIATGRSAVFKGWAGYYDWIKSPQAARTMVAFVFHGDAATIYRRIESVERLPNGNDQITFDRNLPAIDRDRLLRISFVLPARFNQDVFELHHVTDSMKAVKVAVVVKSAEIEGLPDIECMSTSRPYPVQTIDDITIAAGVTGGGFGGFPPFVESLDVAIGVTGGLMQTTLQSAYTDTDALDIGTASVTGGTVSTMLQSVSTDSEGIDIAANVTSGNLINLLVAVVVDSEAIDLTGASVTGGTLS